MSSENLLKIIIIHPKSNNFSRDAAKRIKYYHRIEPGKTGSSEAIHPDSEKEDEMEAGIGYVNADLRNSCFCSKSIYSKRREP